MSEKNRRKPNIQSHFGEICDLVAFRLHFLTSISSPVTPRDLYQGVKSR